MASYVVLASTSLILWITTVAIYRVTLHPCAKFPGPKLWVITRIPMAYSIFRGRLPYRIADLHDKYGPVVRVAHDISFITAEAWNDIYGKKPGKQQLAKDTHSFFRNCEYNDLLLEPSDVEHSRMRRKFAYAFSDKSLREQEPILLSNITKMTTRLREVSDKPVDISMWFNFVSFDIIGDLTFGENFQCLDSGELITFNN